VNFQHEFGYGMELIAEELASINFFHQQKCPKYLAKESAIQICGMTEKLF